MDVLRKWKDRFHQPVKAVVTLATTAAMIWLFLNFLKGSNVWEVLPRFNFEKLIEIGFILIALFGARSFRFAFLVGREFHAPYRMATGATLQAYALNSLVPFKPGELWRAERLRRVRKKGFVDAAALSIFDRAFDVLFCLIFMLPLGLSTAHGLFGKQVVGFEHIASKVILVIGVAIFIGILFVKQRSWLLKKVDGFRRTAASMKSLMGPMFVTSVVIWIFEYSVCEAIAGALDMSIPVTTMCFVIGFSNLFGAVVPSPGGVGAFEGSVIWLLSTLNGQGYEVATTYSIIVHAVLIIPVTVVGLSWMAIELMLKHTHTVQH